MTNKNKCDSCRNCFSDCQSQPTFISEDVASAENLPLDLVVECDSYVPEQLPDLCGACVNQPERCGGEVDGDGKCARYTDEVYEEEEEQDDDSWMDEDLDDDDSSDTLEGADDWAPTD